MSARAVLADIVRSKEREVAALKERPCEIRVPHGPRKNVASSLRRAPREPLRLIAEIKRKSPSAGELSTTLTACERAIRYAESGARMVSVLCDGPFFGGSWDDLEKVRSVLELRGSLVPVLAKEFVIDERQLREAHARGADAVLLIARILGRDRTRALFDAADALGLESLVEVVSEDEVAWALDAGATLIGVNARDLDTLVMDLDGAGRVLAAIPDTCVPIHLSGLKTPDDVARIAGSRAHAALVGETLMRQDDPRDALRALVSAAAQPA